MLSIKAFATKVDNMCWMPRTHMVDEENQSLQVVLGSLHVNHGMKASAQTKINEYT